MSATAASIEVIGEAVVSIILPSVTTLVRFAFTALLDYVKGLTGFLDFVVSEVPPVADGVLAAVLLTSEGRLSCLV